MMPNTVPDGIVPLSPLISPVPPPQAASPKTNTSKKIAVWLVGVVVVLIGGGLRQLGHQAGASYIRNPQQAASLFHNPFGPRPLAASLRQFQQGDSWEYSISGTATLPSGRTATTTDGTVRSAITSLKLSDFNSLIQTNDTNMTCLMNGQSLPLSHHQTQALSQSMVGTVYLMSDNDGSQGRTRIVRQPQVDTPGIWSSGLTQSSHLDFDNGDSQDETTTVNGSEVVDTALGKFTVWRCTQVETDSNGTKSETTEWFAPQLGMPVKTQGTTTEPDGTVTTLTTDLTKTSVPL